MELPRADLSHHRPQRLHIHLGQLRQARHLVHNRLDVVLAHRRRRRRAKKRGAVRVYVRLRCKEQHCLTAF